MIIKKISRENGDKDHACLVLILVLWVCEPYDLRSKKHISWSIDLLEINLLVVYYFPTIENFVCSQQLKLLSFPYFDIMTIISFCVWQIPSLLIGVPNFGDGPKNRLRREHLISFLFYFPFKNIRTSTPRLLCLLSILCLGLCARVNFF